MTVLWLVLWAGSLTPHLVFWNAWMVALPVCVLIDLMALTERP